MNTKTLTLSVVMAVLASTASADNSQLLNFDQEPESMQRFKMAEVYQHGCDLLKEAGKRTEAHRCKIYLAEMNSCFWSGDEFDACKAQARERYAELRPLVKQARLDIDAKAAAEKQAAEAQLKEARDRNQGTGFWRTTNRDDDFDGSMTIVRLAGVITYTTERHTTTPEIVIVKKPRRPAYANIVLGPSYICPTDFRNDGLVGDAIIDDEEREDITFTVSESKGFLHIKAASYWINKFNLNENLKIRVKDGCRGDETRVEFNIRGQTGF